MPPFARPGRCARARTHPCICRHGSRTATVDVLPLPVSSVSNADLPRSPSPSRHPACPFEYCHDTVLSASCQCSSGCVRSTAPSLTLAVRVFRPIASAAASGDILSPIRVCTYGTLPCINTAPSVPRGPRLFRPFICASAPRHSAAVLRHGPGWCRAPVLRRGAVSVHNVLPLQLPIPPISEPFQACLESRALYTYHAQCTQAGIPTDAFDLSLGLPASLSHPRPTLPYCSAARCRAGATQRHALRAPLCCPDPVRSPRMQMTAPAGSRQNEIRAGAAVCC